MTAELISKRTRNEFREFLVGWTLREIETEFESAHIDCDRNFEPQVSGQRRSFVEQHYRTLDLTKPLDARRLLTAFANIIERAEGKNTIGSGREQAERLIAQLKTCLVRDGFSYSKGSITSATPETRFIFEEKRKISEVTRRAVFDELIITKIAWSGRLTESEFLSRIYDLSSLPSHDGRFSTMAGDIRQHRENNFDWDADWIFTDDRLDLFNTTDDKFLRFLCEMVHPAVRPDTEGAKALVAMFNRHLEVDGWELVEGQHISGRPTFVAQHHGTKKVMLPESSRATDVLSDEYVCELSTKCDSRLTSNDLDGAVTVARTLLEVVLAELEHRLTASKGDYKGDLPKQFKQVTKLLRMDEQRPDLDDRFKDVIRGLVMVVNGLAPIRNKMSDGHARERKPAPHHARMVVNASKTVVAFLIESYHYQREKGLLSAPSRESEAAVSPKKK